MSLLVSRNFIRICFVLLALFACTNARALSYWDTNGDTPGAGNAPSGTWDTVSSNWWGAGFNPDDGNGTPTPYGQDSSVAFSHGSDAVGSYTISVTSGIRVGDMHCDDGFPILTGAPLFLSGVSGTSVRLISALPDHIFTINCALTNDIGTNDPITFNAFHKYKTGTLILGGSNTFTGSIVIEGGTLQLAASECIPNACNLILFNGDTRASDGFIDTPATFATGGFTETLGTLKLDGPNPAIARTIDFGNSNSTLSFAKSSAEDWNGIPLTIVNYTSGADKLRFGTDSTGLTPTQLALIRFNDVNAPGIIDNAGWVTPNLPVFKSAHVVGGQFELTWTAVDQRTYRLEFRDSLATGWNILTDIPASGNSVTTTDSVGPTTRFYRVELLP